MTYDIRFHNIGSVTRTRSNDQSYQYLFPDDDIEKIYRYGINLVCESDKKRRYIVEIHHYGAFGLIKFYPKSKQSDPKKYELRKAELGYILPRREFFALMYNCAIIMRDYLEKYSNNFVGYVGAVDSKDGTRNREFSQRAKVYNVFTSSVFLRHKISSKKNFQEVNLRLIRKQVSKQTGKITRSQMENYQKFLNYFESKASTLYDLMTSRKREEVMQEMWERRLEEAIKDFE